VKIQIIGFKIKFEIVPKYYLLAGVVRVGVLAGFVALLTFAVVAIEWLVEFAVERHAAVLEVFPAVRHALVADVVFENAQKLQIMICSKIQN
jgi:hypothetical protein